MTPFFAINSDSILLLRAVCMNFGDCWLVSEVAFIKNIENNYFSKSKDPIQLTQSVELSTIFNNTFIECTANSAGWSIYNSIYVDNSFIKYLV